MTQPRMRISATVIGGPDAQVLANFYNSVGMEATRRLPGWVRLQPQAAGPASRSSTRPTTSPPTWPPAAGAQQMMAHLDIAVEDLDAGVVWAQAAGATLARFPTAPHVRVMLDPAGHPFCLFVGPGVNEGDAEQSGLPAALGGERRVARLQGGCEMTPINRERGILLSRFCFYFASSFEPCRRDPSRRPAPLAIPTAPASLRSHRPAKRQNGWPAGSSMTWTWGCGWKSARSAPAACAHATPRRRGLRLRCRGASSSAAHRRRRPQVGGT